MHKKLKIPDKIRLDSSSNGYVTGIILHDYIFEVYTNVDLVFSDRCTTHLVEEITDIYSERNITHISIPSSCTKYVQPLDIAVFKSFKAKLDDSKRLYIENNIDNRTSTGNIKNPKRQDAIDWVNSAVEALNSDLMKSSFKLCNLFNLHGEERIT